MSSASPWQRCIWIFSSISKAEFVSGGFRSNAARSADREIEVLCFCQTRLICLEDCANSQVIRNFLYQPGGLPSADIHFFYRSGDGFTAS
jgi:hypothetical protein